MKSPSIATYKIIKQGEKGVYQIVREDGTDIVYINFGAMLKDISRDDLTELYRIVMNRYGMDGPEDELEKVFWKYLKNMFEEPLSTDHVWSLLSQQRIISWRYYDSCRVHCLNLESMDIYMLIERKYPLSAEICKAMLDKKLQGGKPDENCYKMLKMMEKQAGSLPSNTVTNPKEDLKGITTRSGHGFPTNNGITEDVQPPVVPIEKQNPVFEPVNAPVSAPMPNLKSSIPYPSRQNDERHRENANKQKEKFYEIFKDMSFEISFMDSLTLMPKFASTFKALIGNKEKLSDMARTPLNEHCSAVILNKLPEKLGDPGRFLIPCKFPGMDECLALADLGASINLMPFSVWKKLNLPNLTSTCMTLELADRSIS
ncbi:reverse transcriptase domain-containing protein [Tanacetum coccineum]